RPRVTTHHRVLLVRFVLSVPVSRDHRDLHPFPTRRSSDLARCLPARGRGQDAAHLAPSDEHVVGPLEFRRDARRGAQRLLQRRRRRQAQRAPLLGRSTRTQERRHHQARAARAGPPAVQAAATGRLLFGDEDPALLGAVPRRVDQIRIRRSSDFRHIDFCPEVGLLRQQGPQAHPVQWCPRRCAHAPRVATARAVTIRVVTDIDIHTTAGKLADHAERLDEAATGNPRAIEKQHEKGKRTARERLEALLDEGSFVELDALARHRSTNFGMEANRPYGDGVVTGYGTIEGREVCVYAQDFTVLGGSLGQVSGEKITKIQDLALRTGRPIIGISDSGGARIQEGVASLGGYSDIFFRNVRASGVIPQISLIMGPCAGGAVYSPAITDFTVMVDQTSHMFITGPDVVRAVTGEDVGMEELGGGRTHNAVAGNAHYLAADEEDALEYVKQLLSYFPSNNLDEPPMYESKDFELDLTAADIELDTIIPDSANQPYDMHKILEAVLDDGE